MDSTRNGGSNGFTTYSNYNVLKLLKSKSAFIRKVKGVKLVKMPATWHCLYIIAGGQGQSEYMADRKVSI